MVGDGRDAHGAPLRTGDMVLLLPGRRERGRRRTMSIWQVAGGDRCDGWWDPRGARETVPPPPSCGLVCTHRPDPASPAVTRAATVRCGPYASHTVTSNPPPPAPPAGRPAGASPAGLGPRRQRRSAVLIAALLLGFVLILASGGAFRSRGPADPSGSPSASTGASAGSPSAPSPTGSGGSTSPSPTGPEPSVSLPPPRAPGDFLLLTRTELLARPTSGPAWDALLAIAAGPPGRPDLRDQDERHGVTTLAAALVYARTGDVQYRERAEAGIMAVIGTERQGDRQLDPVPWPTARVVRPGRRLHRPVGRERRALPRVARSHPDPYARRPWPLGGADRDPRGLGEQLGIVRGSVADRGEPVPRRPGRRRPRGPGPRGLPGRASKWDAFQPVEGSASWACEPRDYVPVNPPCSRGGDRPRRGHRSRHRPRREPRWPPGEHRHRLHARVVAGAHAAGRTRDGEWLRGRLGVVGSALRRAADFVSRSGVAGGDDLESLAGQLPRPVAAQRPLRARPADASRRARVASSATRTGCTATSPYHRAVAVSVAVRAVGADGRVDRRAPRRGTAARPRLARRAGPSSDCRPERLTAHGAGGTPQRWPGHRIGADVGARRAPTTGGV